MASATPTFITRPIFTYSSANFLRQTSFVSPAPKNPPVPALLRLPTRKRLRTTLKMRKTRNRPSSHSPIKQKSLENQLENLAYIWRNANSPERLIISTAAIATVAVIGLMLNALFHVSLFLAFSAVPLLFIPVAFAFLASFTAFAFLTLAIAGVGVLFVGTPFFAVSIIANAVLPAAILAGAVALFLGQVLRSKNAEHTEEPSEALHDVDDLEQFDRLLRNRQTQKTIDASRWNISDVVDELDYVGLGTYRQLFIEERIDGPALLDLTHDEIRTEFGKSMPLGDRMRLTRLVAVLRKQSNQLP